MEMKDTSLGVGNGSIRRNPSKGGWKAAIFIIFVEVAERFAYYGVSGNLITYLTNVLGEATATAAKNVNVWHGVSAVFPLVGGFVADSYFGRFKTILLSSVVYLLGLALLIISVSSVTAGHHRPTLFFIALYIINVGEGGHRPCVQTFAADQFDEELPEEKVAKSSFFNWWYLGIVFGATSAILVVIYVQDSIGWTVGFGIPTAVVAMALVVFLAGRRTYRLEVPVGSPFTRVAQVIVAATKKRWLSAARDGRGTCCEEGGLEASCRTSSLAPTSQFGLLDKATIIDEIDASMGKRNHWRLCSVNQVEEVKLLLRLIPIWLSCLMFAVVIAQLGTYFTKQGSTMMRTIGWSHFQVPPASLQVIPGLTILIAVPIYDRVLVPAARKLTGHATGITMLQRMGIGIFLATMTMVVSALVEAKRIGIARDYDLIDKPKVVIPISVWWLTPQYVLCGLSDVFTIVGMQELFYDQMPEEMRSMGAAAYLSIVGVGSFMSSAIISVVQAVSARYGDEWLGDNLNRAHLDRFYWVLASLSGLSLFLYVFVAKAFVYKKLERDDLNEGNELVFRGENL